MSEGQQPPRYRIELTPAAQRDLKALAWSTLRHIDRSILCLAENPRPRGVKKLKGARDLYRHRAGDYRIIYQIQDNVHLVTLVRVRHRRDVYRRQS